MTRSTWAMLALCATGLAFGWWLMGTLAQTGDTRPPLVQRIPSLPAARELPPLGNAKQALLDTITSPGGSVWALLGDGSKNTLCEFPRQNEGGVGQPHCRALHRKLTGAGWRLVTPALDPVLMAPRSSEPLGVVAMTGLGGHSIQVRRTPGGALSVEAPRGSRLVRSFRESPNPNTSSRLEQASPGEGVYVGPITGFAATHPVPVSGPPDSVAVCTTPAGDIEVSRASVGPPSLRTAEDLEIQFWSKGEAFARTSGMLQGARLLDAPLSCGPRDVYLTWLGADGSLHETSCGVTGCEHSKAALPDVPKQNVLALARVGDNTAIIWQDKTGQALVRLGSLARFSRAPTAPLFAGARTKDLRISASVGTGQSLLLFLELPELKVVQLFSDGKLAALAPRDADAGR